MIRQKFIFYASENMIYILLLVGDAILSNWELQVEHDRRSFLIFGGAALLVPRPAQAAFWPLAWKAIEGAAALWGALEAGKGIYDIISQKSKDDITKEAQKSSNNYHINKYYNLNNEFKLKEFRNSESGVICSDKIINYNIFFVSTANENTISLGSGLAIAANMLISEFLHKYSDKEKLVAYTRPSKIISRSRSSDVGVVFKKHRTEFESSYGSVRLEWVFDPEDLDSSRYAYNLNERVSGRRII